MLGGFENLWQKAKTKLDGLGQGEGGALSEAERAERQAQKQEAMAELQVPSLSLSFSSHGFPTCDSPCPICDSPCPICDSPRVFPVHSPAFILLQRIRDKIQEESDEEDREWKEKRGDDWGNYDPENWVDMAVIKGVTPARLPPTEHVRAYPRAVGVRVADARRRYASAAGTPPGANELSADAGGSSGALMALTVAGGLVLLAATLVLLLRLRACGRARIVKRREGERRARACLWGH